MGHPNSELVVYALYLLGGESHPVHTEDVALKCFELFPDSFSWVKLEPKKRRSLSNARFRRTAPAANLILVWAS